MRYSSNVLMKKVYSTLIKAVQCIKRPVHKFFNYIGICSYTHRRGASCTSKIALSANWIIMLL